MEKLETQQTIHMQQTTEYWKGDIASITQFEYMR